MSSNPVIKVEGLAKTYQVYARPLDRVKQILLGRRKQYYSEFIALAGASFTLEKGETFGIIGRNGAGKSTLLQLITGVMEPTHGSIETHGKIAALLELGAGFNPEFTGRENIYLVGSIYGLSRTQIDQRVDAIIDFSGVRDFIDQPIKTYSSGMFVRLAFSVISNVDADILVVDEALAVGDAVFQQKCLRYLEKFKAEGGSILFVSHDLSMVTSLCNRVLYLKKDQGHHTATVGASKDLCNLYLADTYSDIHGSDRAASKGCGEVHFERNVQESIEVINPKVRSRVSVSSMNQNAESFGTGTGEILDVFFSDDSGQLLKSIIGGQVVQLNVKLYAYSRIIAPSLSVLIKDRAGKIIFAECTVDHFESSDISMEANSGAFVSFKFNFPILVQGGYLIDLAFADGSKYDHQQVQWLHDVLSLSVTDSLNVVGVSGFNGLQLFWGKRKHEV